jgi:hypothetical protein
MTTTIFNMLVLIGVTSWAVKGAIRLYRLANYVVNYKKAGLIIED